MVVFSLMGWSPLIPSEFLVFRRTRCIWAVNLFAYKPVTFFGIAFQLSSAKVICSVWYQKGISTPPSGSSVFARHYSRNRSYFLFLRVLRCFSSPGSPSATMNSLHDNVYFYTLSSLIRISTDRRIFAPPRSFSQLVTSFFGAMYQGILRMLFVAWSFSLNSIFTTIFVLNPSLTKILLLNSLLLLG